MKHSFKVGFSFGLTSGIITTLGLMVGLAAGTNSRLAVIGGILTIAIADAFSDALGIHVSEEAENEHTTKEIWTSTLATFVTKAAFASLFIVPVLAFSLDTAVIVSIAVGILMIGIFSYIVARQEKAKPWEVIGEHVLIATLVVVTTHFVGVWINATFK